MKVSKRTIAGLQSELRELSKTCSDIPSVLVGKIVDLFFEKSEISTFFEFLMMKELEFELGRIESIFSLNAEERKDYDCRLNIAGYLLELPWPIGKPYLYHYGSVESLAEFKKIIDRLSQALGTDMWIHILFSLAIESKSGYSLRVEYPPRISTEFYFPPVDLSQYTQWTLSPRSPERLTPLDLHSGSYEYQDIFFQNDEPANIPVIKKPAYWFSVLQDIVKSSIDALDIILDKLDYDVAPLTVLCDESTILEQMIQQILDRAQCQQKTDGDLSETSDDNENDRIENSRQAVEAEAVLHSLPQKCESNKHWISRTDLAIASSNGGKNAEEKEKMRKNTMVQRRKYDHDCPRGAVVVVKGQAGWSSDGLYWKKHENSGKNGTVFYYRTTVETPLKLPKEPTNGNKKQ